MEKYIYDKEKLPKPILKNHPEWVDIYYKTWEVGFKNVDYVEKEGWLPQLTCFPGVGVIWQWDSCIMTFITNYSNGTLPGFNNLDNLYRLRDKETGYMAMAYNIEREESEYPGRINPPLMAWAEWEHYLVTGDDSRFERVLPALEGMFEFIEKNRTRSNGLYWFEDSGSSGMDNSPRCGYFCENLKGSDVCFVDLAFQQALSAKCIANILNHLNSDREAYYREQYERIKELINNQHWSDKGKYYYDLFARDNPNNRFKYINTKTAAGFWCLESGVADGYRKRAVVDHLFNPEEFYTKIPFASLSKDDLNFEPSGGYWLGGVWPPTNYAAIKGLKSTGYPELAREAAIRFLDAMVKVDKDPAYGGIWEVYAPEGIRPATTEKGIMCRSNFVGWGGIAPVTLLIENIIGLSFNAKENTVTFRIPAFEECGLENMNFNGGNVSVECIKYESYANKTQVRVKTQKPVKLKVYVNYYGDNAVEIDVPQGEHIFNI